MQSGYVIRALSQLLNAVKYGTITRPENERISSDDFGEYGPTLFGPTNITIENVLQGVYIPNNVVFRATKKTQVNSMELLGGFGSIPREAVIWSGPADTIPENSMPVPFSIFDPANNRELGAFRWLTTLTVKGEPTRVRHFQPGEWILDPEDRIIIFFPTTNGLNSAIYSIRMSDR